MHQNPRAQEMESTWKWTPESKLCFVTTGATAPFIALIESVLSIPTIEALHAEGFTHLLIQYGSAKEVFTKNCNEALDHLKQDGQEAGMVIEGIDFSSEGLQRQFKLVQQSGGLLISHAGMLNLQYLLQK
jgi:beta-1,4-N-acetylglucosaminyltransferase